MSSETESPNSASASQARGNLTRHSLVECRQEFLALVQFDELQFVLDCAIWPRTPTAPSGTACSVP
jgi:hypothetical protein